MACLFQQRASATRSPSNCDSQLSMSYKLASGVPVVPFHTVSSQSSDSLNRLKDGRFQLISGGSIAALMTGHSYVLAENRLATFLENIAVEGFRPLPATIWRRRTNEEFTTHKELRIHSRFDSGDIFHLDLSGDRVFFMDRKYLFVTPSLKSTLQAAGFDYLCFTEGLDDFAGHAQ